MIAALYPERRGEIDRKSTRLNSSHTIISYAVFCLKKKQSVDWQALARPGRGGDAPRAGAGGGLRKADVALQPGDVYFFFNDTAPTGIYPLSLHDPLPI